MGQRKSGEAAERRSIGAEISRRMVAAGKKPADLAAAADLDDSQMSKVLSGRAGLSLYSLRRVAEALGCTRADILSVADAPPKGRPSAPRLAAARALDKKRSPQRTQQGGSDVLGHGHSLPVPAPRS